MEIQINSQTVDITADSEKTVGEVLAGLEDYFENSGHRVSGLAIDGETVRADFLDEAFSKELETIKILDIHTNSLTNLMVECLLNICNDVGVYENHDYKEKSAFFENWKQSPQAKFADGQMPDIHALCVSAFSGNTNPQVLINIAGERLQEIENTEGEFISLESKVKEICKKLIDLPIDIQTGKDVQAAQTIQIFSGITEKIIRIFKLLKPKMSETEIITNLINEFNSKVKELLEAYKRNDTVLVGDLAEYEMAPRLEEIYKTIIKINLLLETGNRE